MANRFKEPKNASSWTSDSPREFWTRMPAPVLTPMSYPRLQEFKAAQNAYSLVARVIWRGASLVLVGLVASSCCCCCSSLSSSMRGNVRRDDDNDDESLDDDVAAPMDFCPSCVNGSYYLL